MPLEDALTKEVLDKHNGNMLVCIHSEDYEEYNKLYSSMVSIHNYDTYEDSFDEVSGYFEKTQGFDIYPLNGEKYLTEYDRYNEFKVIKEKDVCWIR